MDASTFVRGVTIATLLVIVLADGVSAQPPVAGSERFLRLEDLERLALEKNPTVAQVEAIARAVASRKLQTGLYPNPLVGYHGEDITAREPGRGKHFFWVQQSIVTAGKRQLVQAAAAQEQVHAAAEQAMQRQRVLNAVRMGFYEVLGAVRLVELQRELAGLAREAVDVSEDLYNVGQADRPDVLEVGIEAERRQIELGRAENNLARAWEDFTAVLGQPDLPFTPLAGDLEAEVPALDEAAVRAQILRESPELRIARARVEHAKASLARSRAERIPNFFVRAGSGYNFDRATSGRDVGAEFFVEIGVPLPLFDRHQGMTVRRPLPSALELSTSQRSMTTTRAGMSTPRYRRSTGARMSRPAPGHIRDCSPVAGRSMTSTAPCVMASAATAKGRPRWPCRSSRPISGTLA